MSAATEQRKLAAIMFTDMVGYTALSQRNETLALELLEEHRHLLRDLFPRFAGQEIKTMGDGFLVEFASALEAAKCAIEIQRALAQRNLSVPSERQLQVRIGIHIGDVVHRGGDVLGDGVNIASRIEPLAEPGGICISVDVAHQIQHNLEAAVVQVGAAALKNVAVPLEVCRIVLPWEKQGPTRSAEAHSREIPAAARSTRRWTAAFLALVGLAVLGAVGWWAYPHFGKAPYPLAVPQAKTPSTTPSPADTRSVAVLPFANLSPDKADEYLSDGLSEELIHLLVRVPGLRVPARTSSFMFKERKEDIRKIGELLNVNTVLEGSVRKAGNRIRVTAQLIKVADGYHLWSETYDRDLGDLLAMQEEIARKIVEKLRVELSGEARQQLARRPTQDPEAHALYLQGLYWWNKRTKASLEKAIQFLNQALDKDPTFAAAYAALAACYCVLPEYAVSPVKEWNPKAQAAAAKALELDPNLAEAHAALGLAKMRQWDWAGAEEQLKLAISLNPNYATGHHWYSLYLRYQGRLDEAMAEIRRAQEADPLSLVILVNVGMCFHFAGDPDRAIQTFRKGLELDSGFAGLHLRLGQVYLSKDMLSEAAVEFQKVRALSGQSPYGLAELGYALARSGNRAEALKILTELEEFGKQGYAVQMGIAAVHLGLGDKDQAFVWLEAASRERETNDDLKTAPFWQALRPDPRFTELLRKMNLR